MLGQGGCAEPLAAGPVQTRVEHDLPPLGILLAEDNRINQLFTEDLLTSRGHGVTVVGNGAEALEALARQRFDLVLMDVQMPEMDGLTATRAIRAHDGGLYDPDIPVLGLSAYAIKGDRERFMAAGMDDYLAKPIRFEDFFRAIRRILFPRVETGEEAPVYDPRQCREELRVSSAVFRRMTTLFLADIPGRRAELDAAVAAGDWGNAGRTVHALGGSAGAVGAGLVLETARRLETAINEGAAETVRRLLPGLVAELERVGRILEAFLAGEAGTPPAAP